MITYFVLALLIFSPTRNAILMIVRGAVVFCSFALLAATAFKGR